MNFLATQINTDFFSFLRLRCNLFFCTTQLMTKGQLTNKKSDPRFRESLVILILKHQAFTLSLQPFTFRLINIQKSAPGLI